MATTTLSSEAKLLEKLSNSLKEFEGRTFEIQGEVAVTLSGEQLTVAIAPLEKVTLKYLGERRWIVSFTINDPDGHGLPWSHVGSYSHVINSFRGYLVGILEPLLSDEELRRVAKLD